MERTFHSLGTADRWNLDNRPRDSSLVGDERDIARVASELINLKRNSGILVGCRCFGGYSAVAGAFAVTSLNVQAMTAPTAGRCLPGLRPTYSPARESASA